MPNETECFPFLIDDSPVASLEPSPEERDHAAAPAEPAPSAGTSGWGSSVWDRPAASSEPAANLPWTNGPAVSTPWNLTDVASSWRQATNASNDPAASNDPDASHDRAEPSAENSISESKTPHPELTNGWTTGWSAPSEPNELAEPTLGVPLSLGFDNVDEVDELLFDDFDIVTDPTLYPSSIPPLAASVGERSIPFDIPFYQLAALQAEAPEAVETESTDFIFAQTAASLAQADLANHPTKPGRSGTPGMHRRSRASQRTGSAGSAGTNNAKAVGAAARPKGPSTPLRIMAAASLAIGIGVFGYTVLRDKTSSPTPPTVPATPSASSVTVPAGSSTPPTTAAAPRTSAASPAPTVPTAPGSPADDLSFSPGGSFSG